MPVSIRRALFFPSVIFGALVLGVACSGGSGSNAPGIIPPNRSIGTFDSGSQSIPLSQTNTPIPLQTVAGITSTISLPSNAAPTGARLTVTASNNLPPFVTPLSSSQTLFESFTLIASDDVTLTDKPAITITLPGAPANQGAYFAWSFSAENPVILDRWATYSNVFVSGHTLKLGGIHQTLTLQKGVAYVIAVLTAPQKATCPTPVPAPTATFVPSATVSPRPLSVAFVENVRGSGSTFQYFVSVFRNGNYNTPSYSVPLPNVSLIHAAPNGTLLALPLEACNLLSFAPGSATATTIPVNGCASNFIVDPTGNVYAVTNGGATIVELQSGNYGNLMRTLTAESGFQFRLPPAVGRTAALFADKAGNLFVVEYAVSGVLQARVEEFAPAGTTAVRSFALDNYPTQIVVDSTGEIYAGATFQGGGTLGYPAGGTVPDVVIPQTSSANSDAGNMGIDSADHLYLAWGEDPVVVDEFGPRSNVIAARATVAISSANILAVDPLDNIWVVSAAQFPILIYPSLSATPTGATDGATFVLGQWDTGAGGFAFVK